MSTQKYTAVMISLYKKKRGRKLLEVFKTKNWGWWEENQYTDALEKYLFKGIKALVIITNLIY